MIRATALDAARSLNAASQKTGVRQPRRHECVVATHDAQRCPNARDVAGTSPAAMLLRSTKQLAAGTIRSLKCRLCLRQQPGTAGAVVTGLTQFERNATTGSVAGTCASALEGVCHTCATSSTSVSSVTTGSMRSGGARSLLGAYQDVCAVYGLAPERPR